MSISILYINCRIFVKAFVSVHCKGVAWTKKQHISNLPFRVTGSGRDGPEFHGPQGNQTLTNLVGLPYYINVIGVIDIESASHNAALILNRRTGRV
jgi:hypothetical protein